MNKKFYISAAIAYIICCVISVVFDFEKQNTLWSTISLLLLFILLDLGSITNIVIYKEKNSILQYLFHYIAFMCSLAIVMNAILSCTIVSGYIPNIIIISVFSIVLVISALLVNNKRINEFISMYLLVLSIIIVLISVILTAFIDK